LVIYFASFSHRDGTLLASGSKENEIVIWDVDGERGLYRFFAFCFLFYAFFSLVGSVGTLTRLLMFASSTEQQSLPLPLKMAS
jgi:hypothetical protein